MPVSVGKRQKRCNLVNEREINTTGAAKKEEVLAEIFGFSEHFLKIEHFLDNFLSFSGFPRRNNGQYCSQVILASDHLVQYTGPG